MLYANATLGSDNRQCSAMAVDFGVIRFVREVSYAGANVRTCSIRNVKCFYCASVHGIDIAILSICYMSVLYQNGLTYCPTTSPAMGVINAGGM